MSWNRISQILDVSLSAYDMETINDLIGESPLLHRKEAKDLIVKKEADSSMALDDACKKFAHTQKWPPLTKEQNLVLLHRLRQARDFLRFLETGKRGQLEIVPDFDGGIQDSEVLEYLLIYYWSHIGRHRYLSEQTLHL